jgi:hypothetical protein
LPLFCCKRKKIAKKREREILKTLEAITRFDELAKEFLAKATTTNPKKNK